MEKFLKDWLDSWSGNRPDLTLSFYHPEVMYFDPANCEGLFGRDNLSRYLGKLLAKFPDWKWELLQIDRLGPNRCYVKWKLYFKDKSTTGLDLVEMKDGLILRNEVYFDPAILK